MSYGLTPEGFTWMTAPVIYDRLASGFRGLPGLANLRTDALSHFTNLTAPYVEQTSIVWETLGAVYHSLDPRTAEDAQLDARGASVMKGRLPQKQSTVLLTLYNRTRDQPVDVLAGNQARQSATGVLWETSEDAVIPALQDLLTGLDIDTIENIDDGIDRATFNGTPDLAAVAIGDTITITGAANTPNNGTFTITDLDVDAYWVEYASQNSDGTNDEASDTAAQATITDTEASVTVPGRSLDFGPFQATPGTINQINTPVPGWDAVNNLVPAQAGRVRESDTDFRRRILTSPVISQGGIAPAIIQKLLDVQGVTYATVEENDTAGTVDGMEPHSIRATVVGGEDQDIWNAIGSSKGAAIGTNGSEVGYWADPQGLPKIQRFNRVAQIPPYITVEITAGTGFPTSTAEATIQARLAELKYKHGDPLIVHVLSAAVSGLGLPGTLGITVKVSRTPAPTLSDNLTAAITEVFVIDPNLVSLVIL